MNSFRTQDDTLAALAPYADLEVDDLGLDFLQNSEPKLLADDLTPAEWPADPTLEWCPPGHGDLYTALEGSGILDRLLAKGYRYASVSNSDNLGAAPDATIAGWFAASGAPYAAEICQRTAADRKGGHLAIRKADQQLILRDTAQTAEDEMHFFTDEFRHPYFHTNNLWFDLEVLSRTLKERNSVLGLPLIKNEKTVDPADSSSPEVVQIESAMGAAIEVFPGATAIGVGRERFLPVKTTNDLLLLRSDVYEVGSDGRLTKVVEKAPLIELDSRFYKTIGKFEDRFPAGAPSLNEATSLRCQGRLDLRGRRQGHRGRHPGRSGRAPRRQLRHHAGLISPLGRGRAARRRRGRVVAPGGRRTTLRSPLHRSRPLGRRRRQTTARGQGQRPVGDRHG